MKRIKLMIAAAVAIAAMTGMNQGALAQTDKGEWQGKGMGPGMGKPGKKQAMDPAERLRRMEKHLGLTEEQKGTIKPILDEEAKELKALREDTSLSRDQKREKLQTLRTKYHDQITQVLTPEQKKKADAMREKAKERHDQRQQMKGGPKQAPATP
ncbi:MAG: hypothetical protein ED859_00700 [Desulfuromonadales bacterium]|nr:MAG: hypothetical protein ED859_00700 [Desulfuromonadales bacterium]